jgi:hypothetical protein
MEVFADIFWHGDQIVWVNLFRHFLLCLNTAWVLLADCREDRRLIETIYNNLLRQS